MAIYLLNVNKRIKDWIISKMSKATPHLSIKYFHSFTWKTLNAIKLSFIFVNVRQLSQSLSVTVDVAWADNFNNCGLWLMATVKFEVWRMQTFILSPRSNNKMQISETLYALVTRAGMKHTIVSVVWLIRHVIIYFIVGFIYICIYPVTGSYPEFGILFVSSFRLRNKYSHTTSFQKVVSHCTRHNQGYCSSDKIKTAAEMWLKAELRIYRFVLGQHRSDMNLVT